MGSDAFEMVAVRKLGLFERYLAQKDAGTCIARDSNRS